MTTDPFPDPPPGLDALVRRGLEADAARTDGPAVWAAVAARLAADEPPVVPAGSTRRRLLARAGGLLALAAGVLVAVAVWPAGRELAASPADVVRGARAAHAGLPDRCYTQAVSLSAEAAGRFPLLADRELAARVWTRGDRFVAESAVGGAWGREPDGRVWFAPDRRAAARFRPAELPPVVREAVAVRGLELEPLLGGLLADFDLTWAAAPGVDTHADRVSAARRGPVAAFEVASAELTVDRTLHVVRRLVVRRALPAGEAVVTFELAEAGDRPDAAYTAAGHLDGDRPVYDADRPVLRRRVLVQGFGRLIANGL